MLFSLQTHTYTQREKKTERQRENIDDKRLRNRVSVFCRNKPKPTKPNNQRNKTTENIISVVSNLI